jgi:hypothetical protein
MSRSSVVHEMASLVFRPDGLCVGMYTELIDLSKLGHLRVRRATRIEFDDGKQAWRVKDRNGFALFTAPSRRQCLAWERQYFNSKIEREHS